VLREHRDPDPGVLGADLVRGLDALHVVAGGHADVGEHRVGAEPAHRVAQLLAVAHGGQHLDGPGVLQEPSGAFAHEVVVLGDDDAQPLSAHARSAGSAQP